MNENAVPKVQGDPLFPESLTEVLPDHEGETEEQDLPAPVLLQKGLHSLQIQFHVVVEGVAHGGSEDGEAQDARTPGGEHGPVPKHLFGVDDQHGEPVIAHQRGGDAEEGLLLVGRGSGVQKDPGDPLAGGAGGSDGLKDLAVRYTFELQILKDRDRQEGDVLRSQRAVRHAQPIQQGSVGRAVLPVIAGQFGETVGKDGPLLRPGEEKGSLVSRVS